MDQKGGLSILDALDNLNTLVDVDSLEEIEVTEEQRLISHKGEEEGGAREIYWVKAGPDDQTLWAIKNTFGTVHTYLKTFYQTLYKSGESQKLTEGINTIMILVGEATQKVDRFGSLFQKKIIDCEEYKALQHFYQQKVMPESFKTLLRTSLPSKARDLEEEELIEESTLTKEEEVEQHRTHLLDDMELVRKDDYYELFYLTTEEGRHFYTHHLASHLKLACNFGLFVDQYFGDDPLLQIKNWEDKELHLRAQQLLKSASHPLEKFYVEFPLYKDREIVKLIHYGCMALFLAANPRNLIRQFSLKGCHLYFSDFLRFLREVLLHREFEKMATLGTSEEKPFFRHCSHLVASFIHNLFTQPLEREEIAEAIEKIIEESDSSGKGTSLSESLSRAHHALLRMCAHHPNGPLFKALDILCEEEEGLAYDPWMLGNLPERSWTFRKGEEEWCLLRLPAPVVQPAINHALISEEFKVFVQGCIGKERLLLINLQDRTSWREHARTLAIENLSLRAEYADHLTVVTLTKESDFYQQKGDYYELNDAREFIEQFLDHLGDDNTGYFFPPSVHKLLFPHFMEHLLWQIHETFFKHKKKLSCIERLDFIEVAYAFITLKLIEIVHPKYVALSSKDALDIEGISSLEVVALLSLARHQTCEEKKRNALLFGPTLMLRDRVIQLERFDRLLSMVRLLEKREDYLTPFTSLFAPSAFDWEIS